jgi:hypothetical protein
MKTTAPALASCALLVCLILQPPAGAEAAVVSLSHSPASPTPDDDITVTLQLDNASSVTTTLIVWCQSKPALCNWKNMTYIGENTFTISIGKFVDGQEIKYNVSIAYADGNTSVTETNHFKVEKPSNGNGGNNNNTTNNNTNTTGNDDAGKTAQNYMPYIAVAVIVVAVAVAAVFMMRRKKPGSQ